MGLRVDRFPLRDLKVGLIVNTVPKWDLIVSEHWTDSHQAFNSGIEFRQILDLIVDRQIHIIFNNEINRFWMGLRVSIKYCNIV